MVKINDDVVVCFGLLLAGLLSESGWFPIVMNIKSKITLGFLALLGLLIVLGSYAHYTVQRLDSRSRSILAEGGLPMWLPTCRNGLISMFP